MTRKNPEGSDLGGIGTMLIQSDVCPACGKVHESRLLRYLPSGARGVPLASAPPMVPMGRDTGASPNGVRSRKGGPHRIPWTIPVYSEEQP